MLGSIELLTDIVGVNGAGEICHPYRVRVGVHTAKFCINFKKNRNKSFAAVNQVILRSLIEEGEFKEVYLILNRYDSARAKAGAMLKAEDVSEILYTPITGIIPESREVLEASNSGHPVTHFSDPIAAKAYFDAVDRILGKDIPMRYTEQKTSFFKKLIGKS